MGIFDIMNISEEFEIIAAVQLHISRTDHHDDARPIDKAVAPRLVSHLAGNLSKEDVVLLVVHHQLHTVIYEHAAPAVHQQFAGIAITRLHGYSFKVILTGIAAHTIDGGHPQAPLIIAEQSLHVIIRQT